MSRKGKPFAISVTFGLMFLFWILLSGMWDAFHLISGVICSGIVALISHDLLVKEKGEKIFLMSSTGCCIRKCRSIHSS